MKIEGGTIKNTLINLKPVNTKVNNIEVIKIIKEETQCFTN